MTDDKSTRNQRMGAVVANLSPRVLAVIGIVLILGVSGGGYYAYRTYDYVQHDNDFCMSCHLMQEPFELFAQSAHQGLSCKACHRPNIVQRSSMGLTAIVENPEQISVHAEVPNEICAECHIQGDPEKWRLIANSAGHRVHLQSDDPRLQGLQCVQCHSVSLHEFAPIDRTCAQSGCHEDKKIELGAMSDLTIHCAACHNFVAPVGEPSVVGNAVDAAILPDYDDCLSCHAMRTRVQMPDPDPHQGQCAACHNPHVQTDPAQAADKCASSGCHDDPLSITPFHRGLQRDADCLECHQAHDFRLDGSNCTSCHQDTMPPAVVRINADLTFAHDDHSTVSCVACHVSRQTHGDLQSVDALVGVQDCRGCHHTAPVSRDCMRCHQPSDAPTTVFRRTQAIHLDDVGLDESARVFTYPHAAHAQLDCSQCHTEGQALAPADDLDCDQCHEEHHSPETDCSACHRVAPASAHPPDRAHVTCTGSGCHTSVPFDGLPRNRAFCEGCHQDLREHQPGRECIDCHTLPQPLEPGREP